MPWADEDRPRDRAAQRRRRRAVRARARRGAARARPRRARRRRHDPARARSRWSTSPPSSTSRTCTCRACSASSPLARRRAPSLALRRLLQRTPARRAAHAHGEGGHDRPHRGAARRARAAPRVVHTFHGHVLCGLLRRAARAGLPAGRARARARTTDRIVAVSEQVRDDLVALRRRAGREVRRHPLRLRPRRACRRAASAPRRASAPSSASSATRS